MEKIESASNLKNVIMDLENQQSMDSQAIKDELKEDAEMLKPINILRRVVAKFIATPGLTRDIKKGIVIFIIGAIFKKMFGRQLNHPLVKVLAVVAEMLILNMLANKLAPKQLKQAESADTYS